MFIRDSPSLPGSVTKAQIGASICFWFMVFNLVFSYLGVLNSKLRLRVSCVLSLDFCKHSAKAEFSFEVKSPSIFS